MIVVTTITVLLTVLALSGCNAGTPRACYPGYEIANGPFCRWKEGSTDRSPNIVFSGCTDGREYINPPSYRAATYCKEAR